MEEFSIPATVLVDDQSKREVLWKDIYIYIYILVHNMIDTYIKTSVPMNALKHEGVGKQMQESWEED